VEYDDDDDDAFVLLFYWKLSALFLLSSRLSSSMFGLGSQQRRFAFSADENSFSSAFPNFGSIKRF
jgi:hypothetical protein